MRDFFFNCKRKQSVLEEYIPVLSAVPHGTNGINAAADQCVQGRLLRSVWWDYLGMTQGRERQRMHLRGIGEGQKTPHMNGELLSTGLASYLHLWPIFAHIWALSIMATGLLTYRSLSIDSLTKQMSLLKTIFAFSQWRNPRRWKQSYFFYNLKTCLLSSFF